MIAAFTRHLEQSLLRKISDRYGVSYERLSFSIPPRIDLGELALPIAFDLARKVRRAPADIARELAQEAATIPGVWKAEVAGGGYLNFRLDRVGLTLKLADSIEKKLHGLETSDVPSGKVIVEHTNINPNKAAHIGHLRNAVLGDSFVRCLRFLGHEVEVQNYLDNTGVQVADVVVGLEQMERLTLDQVAAQEGRLDYYCWDVYARVSDFYRQSEENQQHRSRTLQAIEAGNNPTANLAEHVAMRIARAHLATMARINVYYDLLPRESEILHLHFWERAFELLKARGAIYFVEDGKNRGCWVMKTGERQEGEEAAREELEDDEKIIVRSDGTVTYVGKDIAYQLWKFGLLGLDFFYRPFNAGAGGDLWVTATEQIPGLQVPHFGAGRRVYNVIDTRQAYLQSIVLQGLRALGYEEEASHSIHFSYEMVALTPACAADLGVALSEEDSRRPFVLVAGRKGLGVKADDLLDTLFGKALQKVRAQQPELEAAEAESIAQVIAAGALRYFMLRFARNTVIAFDFKEALNFEGEAGPHVQYAVVRADSIFRKLEQAEGNAPVHWKDVETESLREFLAQDDDIWELIYHAARLPEVVRQAAHTLELSQVAKFAYYLAHKFHTFYNDPKYRILSEVDASRKKNLLLVVDIVRQQLKKALDLLGCDVPPKM